MLTIKVSLPEVPFCSLLENRAPSQRLFKGQTGLFGGSCLLANPSGTQPCQAALAGTSAQGRTLIHWPMARRTCVDHWMDACIRAIRYAVAETSWKRALIGEKRMDMSLDSRKASQLHNRSYSLPRVGRVSPWQAQIQTCAQLSPHLSELISQFWGVPVKLTFLGISEKPHYFWRLDDFHVSQLQLEKQTDTDASPPPSALLRLSESLCASLLNRVLGRRPQSEAGFSFRRLSPLEASILNELSRDLLALFKKQLLKKPAPSHQQELVQLLWVANLDESAEQLRQALGPVQAAHLMDALEVGKIVLSVPASALKQGTVSAQPVAIVPDDFFFHVLAPVRIYVGSSRVPLADLDHLEPGDLIVLENSQLDQMALVETQSGQHLPFSARIAHPQAITMPYEQEFDEMDSPMDTQNSGASARQNLWDNLMIEVAAEFEPVKIPLRQLKQMSEGLVIEMDDLLHNQISLSVDGKALALGELIIVGDRFGIRVSRVLAPTASSENPVERVALPAQEALTPAEAPPVEEASPPTEPTGEMDLDSFLNDDFDEAADGEENW